MEGLQNQNDIVPFGADDLVESGISEDHKGMGKFFEINNNPNKVVRVESIDDLVSKHNSRLEAVELVHAGKKLFMELEDMYGIAVPAKFFIGKTKEGNDVVYSVTDKIIGKSLEEAEISDDLVVKVKTLYTSVAKYFLDKYKEGGLYLWDINGESQYVYGKKADEQEDKIYLIDTDVWLNNSRQGIVLSVYWLTRHMSGLERRIGAQFEEARKYIQQFVEQFSDSRAGEAESKNIDAIKDYLNNKKSNYNPESARPSFE